MILSHRHQFVFIKGVKVAGTSVEIALSQICGPEDIITPITPADETYRRGTAGEPRNYAMDAGIERDLLQRIAKTERKALGGIRLPKAPFYNHMSLAEVIELVPQARDYRLLFVERSPYAKAMSFANWHLNQAGYKNGEDLPRTPANVREAVQATIADGSILTVRNIERYRDDQGRIGSCGWRFEGLAESLRDFCQEVGVDPVPMVHAKAGLQSDDLDAASLLSVEQVKYIDRQFADEFETFGYAPLAAAL